MALNDLFDFDIDDEPVKQPLAPKDALKFTHTYPDTLAHDMACAMTDEEVETIRHKYGYDVAEFEYILGRHDYRREYSEWRQRLISEGNSFKLKLRAMAEEFLPQMHNILHSELTAPGVKVDAFKYITKVAGLEPSKEESEGSSSGNKIVIEIANYTAPSSPQTISVTASPTPAPLVEDYCG